MTHVWDKGPEKQGHLLVMLALADYANDEGECWPAVKSVAAKARMSERGVQKIMRQLQDEGWLTVTTGTGRGGCNFYRINPEPSSVNAVRGEQETPNMGTETPNVVPKRVNGGSPEPSRTIIEPSKESAVDFIDPPPERKPRNVRMPKNWVPNDTNIAFASQHLSPQGIQNEASKFRDYHLAKCSKFADWDAAWRNWVRKSVEFRNGGMAGHPHSQAGRSSSSIASIVLRGELERRLQNDFPDGPGNGQGPWFDGGS